MEVNRVSGYQNQQRLISPSFTALRIKEPQAWEKDVLDSFVKNKEVQKIVQSFENIGVDLSAMRGEKEFPVTADNIFLWDDKHNMILSNILVNKDNKNFSYGAVSRNIKQFDEPKPLKAENFFNYLLKKYDISLNHKTYDSQIYKVIKKVLENNKNVQA